jgi:hypothetical protein
LSSVAPIEKSTGLKNAAAAAAAAATKEKNVRKVVKL